MVRVTLAIYITLFAVALMAVAQVLYWRLVIAPEGDASAGVPQPDRMPDMDWLREPAEPWVGFEVDDMEPALVGDPVAAGV
jgi:hypothetical protein